MPISQKINYLRLAIVFAFAMAIHSARAAGANGGLPEYGAMSLILQGGIQIELAGIPPGTFLMGARPGSGEEAIASELERIHRHSAFSVNGQRYDETQRRVEITRPFYMGAHPITQAQYLAVMGPHDFHNQGSDLPADNISWIDAWAFCQKLSKLIGKNVRLPTEAEWEYACRAGTTTPYHTGDGITLEQANFRMGTPDGAMAAASPPLATTPAGSFPPNAWGLYDMHGNVEEWCADAYMVYDMDDTANPRVIGEYDHLYPRVARGGSFKYLPEIIRSASRAAIPPFTALETTGFRIVVSEQPDAIDADEAASMLRMCVRILTAGNEMPIDRRIQWIDYAYQFFRILHPNAPTTKYFTMWLSQKADPASIIDHLFNARMASMPAH